MPYKGHVENGSVVLDEPADLKDGDKVQIERVESGEPVSAWTPLRGTNHDFKNPFTPVVAEDDWSAFKRRGG